MDFNCVGCNMFERTKKHQVAYFIISVNLIYIVIETVFYLRASLLKTLTGFAISFSRSSTK